MRLELANAFIAVSAAQEKYKIARNKREIAEKLHECVVIQVQGAKASPIQEKRAQITLKGACLEEREHWADLEEAKKQLSLMWGDPCPDFDCVDFDLYQYDAPPCQEMLLEGLYLTPDFERARQEVCCASRYLTLEKRNAIPDIVVTVGYRAYNDSNAHGWVVGAQMPIPFFNYNQGNIERARVKAWPSGLSDG